MKPMEVLKGKDAGQIARHRARYGHRDWLIWKDKNNELYAARRSKETLKMAMLATGTQGLFIHVYPDGIGCTVDWSMAAMQWRNFKYFGGA